MQKLIFYLLSFLLLLSCFNETSIHEGRRDNGQEIKIKNIKTLVHEDDDESQEAKRINVNSSFFEYFKKAKKRSKQVEIPLHVISKKTNQDFSSIFFGPKAFAIDYFDFSKNILGVIYAVDCTAGAQCKVYYFATLKKDPAMELIDSEFVGELARSLNREKIFSFKILDSTKVEIIHKTKLFDDYEELLDEKEEKLILYIEKNGGLKLE